MQSYPQHQIASVVRRGLKVNSTICIKTVGLNYLSSKYLKGPLGKRLESYIKVTCLCLFIKCCISSYLDILKYCIYSQNEFRRWVANLCLWLYFFRPNSAAAKKVNMASSGSLTTMKVIKEQYRNLGPITFHERVSLYLQILMEEIRGISIHFTQPINDTTQNYYSK